MKPPVRSRERGLSFNITPLIDIVFLLIIFFLAASHLARSETSQEVTLPEASPQDEEQLPKRLVITITAEEKFFVGANPIDPAELGPLIVTTKAEAEDETFEIQLRSDREVPYRVVEPVLLACARAGVTRVNFMVRPIQ